MRIIFTVGLCFSLIGCGGLATKHVHPASIGTSIAISDDAVIHGFIKFEHVRADGRTRIAYLNPRPKPKGTILYLHGNGTTGRRSLDNVAFLSDFGMDVVVMEYTGYGPHQGRPSDPAMRKDVASIVSAIKARNPERPILMVGSSLGGSLAIMTAMDTGVDGLVTLGAFTRTSDFASPMAGLVVRTANAFDALGAAPNVTLPWAVVHCKDDRTVPVTMGQALHQARRNSIGTKGLINMISECDDHLVPFPIWKTAIKRVIKQLPKKVQQ